MSIKILIVAAVAFLIAVVQGRTLTMYACTDTLYCNRSTCTNMTVPEATCVAMGAGSSYTLTCKKPPTSRCARAGRYADKECTDLVSHDGAVCGTCSMGVMQMCIGNTVFGSFNCTGEATCSGMCHNRISFPLKKCMSLSPIVDPFVPGPFIKVLDFEKCTDEVIFNKAYDTSDCSGTPTGSLTLQQNFCMNHNGMGYMYACN